MQQLLQHVNGRVFSAPNLTLDGENLVATYPTAAICGLSFLLAPLPETLSALLSIPQSGVQEIREISRDEYLAAVEAARPIVAGQEFSGWNEIEFVSGHRIWVETRIGAAVSETQERQILQRIFSSPALACRRADGGINLWNRANGELHLLPSTGSARQRLARRINRHLKKSPLRFHKSAFQITLKGASGIQMGTKYFEATLQPFLSRLAANSSGVTFDCTPLRGTRTLAVHKMALRTKRR